MEAAAGAGALSPGRIRACIALLVAMGFALGASEFVVIGVEPDLAREFDVPLSRVGELISFFAVAYAVCTPLLALSTGRFRRYTLLVAYSALLCVANLVAVLAPSFEMLLAARVLLGAISGALLAVGITYIPEMLGPERTPWTISIVYAAFSVSMVLITPIGKMAAELASWEAAFWGVFILTVAVCIALVAVLPRAGAADAPATMREQLPFLADARILSGGAIFIFGVGAVYVFYAYITPYLEDVAGLDAGATSLVLLGYGCGCFASNLLSGWCSSRFGMPSLVVVFLVQAALLAGLSAAGGAMPQTVVLALLIAVSMYVVSTPCITMFMFIARNECPQATTLAASIEPTSFNLGIAFGTAVGGAVVDTAGMGAVGSVGAVLSLVACALVLNTIRLRKRGRRR